MSKQAATRANQRRFTVSHAHDPAETQAEKAAEVVARGGSVSGWSFGQVPVSASVHREEKGDKPPKKGTPGDVLEALSETPVGKQVIEKVKEREEVKAVLGALDTTGGKVAAGGLAIAGLAGFAAAKKELPAQIPAIPVGTIGGFDTKAALKIEGPVNSPTFVGVTFSFSGHSEGKKKQSSEDYRAETAKLRSQQEALLPRGDKDAEAQWVQSYVAAQSQKLGSVLLPLRAGEKAKTVDAPLAEPAEPEKKEEPVQREPASATETDSSPGFTDSSPGFSDASARIEGALMGGGRPLDSATRRSMEARFGQDFTGVRIHDHATASSAAAGISARAFTVGEDIVFGSGGYDATTTHGRYLLAHELAHVVQQRGREIGGPQHVHRRGVGEWIGIWLGTEEGNWSDPELKAYLGQITSADAIEGSFDADNLARAIVAKWKAASPGYDLSGHQKTLLIKEMLDGPTGDDDEAAILDLITLSDASDLRTIFRSVSIEDLESNIDGEENTRLDNFVAARFDGGRDALKVGRVIVLGPSVPQGAPAAAFSISTIESWFESDRSPEDIAALISTMTESDQDLTRKYLVDVRRERLNVEVERVEAAGPVRTPWKSNPDADKRRRFQLRTERVLLLLYAAAIPADADALRDQTSAVTGPEAKTMQDALVRPRKGEFKAELPGEKPHTYKSKLLAKLDEIIDAYYEALVAKADPRTGTLKELQDLGEIAQKQVNQVFGRFYKDRSPKPYVADRLDANGKVVQAGNLHDNYTKTQQEQDRFSSAAGQLAMARNMMRVILTRNVWVRTLNQEHNASPEYDAARNPSNPEAIILAEVADEFLLRGRAQVAPKQKGGQKAEPTPPNVKRLNEIDRGWPGSATDTDISLALNRPSDPAQARQAKWWDFETMVHEYMHIVVHPDYHKYAETFGAGSPKYNTLIEGVDCLLVEIAWEQMAPGLDALRPLVEGPYFVKDSPVDVTHPGLQRGYPSYSEALKLVELAGVDGLYAAYFLGEVDRIGGTKPAAPAKKPQPRAIHVSEQLDPAEVQAEHAAATVASGGSVAGWSMVSPVATTSAHRAPLADAATPHRAARWEALETSLGQGGRPLDQGTRRTMENRFGHDFGRVRIHDHQSARTAASSLDAQAFTMGNDIAFGSGGYAPETTQGRHLLAHELMHVVQQHGAPEDTGGSSHVHRRSAWEKFTIWIGASEGEWSDKELRDYLSEITTSNKIDGANDADNKARAVVKKWKTASAGFDLTAPQKILLIKEMLDGATFDDDETAILDLLTRSEAGDLRAIMRDVTVRELRSNFHGDESDRLDSFLDARFEGGRKGLKNGAIVKGAPVPKGMPTPRFSAGTVERWFASDRSPDEIAALISAMSKTDQALARDYLVNNRRSKQNVEVERVEAAGQVQTPWRSNADALEARRIQLKTERVLLQLYVDHLPADEAALVAGTATPDAAKAKQMQDVLARPTGAFVPKLPGETKNYEEKLAAKLPEIIDAYYETLVTKAPPRTNTLANLQKLGEAAKPEVDKIFGDYYGGVAHPAFVADQVDAQGTVIKGTLHDQFAAKQAWINIGTKDQLKGMAANMMRAILTRNIWVRGLNDAHGSQPEFDAARDPANDVAKIQIKVTNAFLKKTDKVTMVNEIYRGWPGAADDEGIYQQLGMPTDPADARMQLWDSFQTFVHEYIHTLVHDDYKAYAESFGYRSPKHNALMEGVDCVLEEMVWETIVPRLRDQSFREKIEGKELAKKPPIEVPHAGLLRGYPSYTEALKLIELAGLNNLLAAYFLGRVELIGAPPKPPAKPPAKPSVAPKAAPKKGGKKP